MGGVNQIIYVVEKVGKQHRRVLEVGSKSYGKAVDMSWRQGLTWDEYVGLDLSPGENVDVVGNLEEGLCGLEPESFDLIICCSVLEHCKKPWVVAENLSKLLAKGGKCYIASPWVWKYHAYPDDYWRISFTGIAMIFPELQFERMFYSTYKKGEFLKAEPESENKLGKMIDERKYLPYVEIHALGIKQQLVSLGSTTAELSG